MITCFILILDKRLQFNQNFTLVSHNSRTENKCIPANQWSDYALQGNTNQIAFTWATVCSIWNFEWKFVYILQVHYILDGVLPHDELPISKVAFYAHSARHERQMEKKKKKKSSKIRYVYSLVRVCMDLFRDKIL